MATHRPKAPRGSDSKRSDSGPAARAAADVKTGDFIDRGFARFAASLELPPEGSRVARKAVILVAVFALLLAVSPTLYLDDMMYDIFVPLDGAWRMINGQWPHLDFYTPIGDLYYALLGLAGWLFGPGAKVVLWANVLLAPVAVLAAVQATRHRLPESIRALLIVVIGLLCLSPRSLNEISNISFLASYNRHSWTLILPLMLAALLPKKEGRDAGWQGDAMLMTALIVMLFYLKVTFAAAGLGVLAASALLVRGNRRAAVWAIAGSVAVLGTITFAGPLNAAYFADLARAARAEPLQAGSDDPFRFLKLRADILAEWFDLLAPLCFGFWLSRSARTPEERDSGAMVLLLTMIASAVSIGLAWQNHDHAMPTQIVAMTIAFAGLWRRWQARRSRSATAPRDGSMILAGVLLVFIAGVFAFNDGRAILGHTIRSVFEAGHPAGRAAAPLRGIQIIDDPVTLPPAGLKTDQALLAFASEDKNAMHWPTSAPLILDDAARLFAEYRPKDARVATLFFSLVLSWTTQTPPPRHLPAWIDPERTFGPASPIDPEKTFDDTTVIFVPKWFNEDMAWDQTKDYITAHFTLVAETPLWKMWVRKGVT